MEKRHLFLAGISNFYYRIFRGELDLDFRGEGGEGVVSGPRAIPFITFLSGENGTGKSKLLEGVLDFRHPFGEFFGEEEEVGGALHLWNSPAEVELHRKGGYNRFHFVVDTPIDGLNPGEEIGLENIANWDETSVDRNEDEPPTIPLLGIKERVWEGVVSGKQQSEDELQLPTGRVELRCVKWHNHYPWSLKELLVSYLKRKVLEEGRCWQEVVEEFQQIFKKVAPTTNFPIELTRVVERKSTLKLYCKKRVGDYASIEFEFEELSEGEKEIFYKLIFPWLTNIRNSIVLIDEPESSLSATNRTRLIYNYYLWARENRNQLIIATHNEKEFKKALRDRGVNSFQNLHLWFSNGKLQVRKKVG